MLGQRRIEPEDDSFERPAPPARERLDGSGGVLRWVVAAVAIGIFGASVWYAYQRGNEDAAADRPPPLVKADQSPTKLRPEEPGGLDIPNRDKLIFDRLVANAPDKRVERLLPPPETPMPKPTAADEAAAPVSVGSPVVVPPAPVERQKPPPARTDTLTLKLDSETQQPLAPAQPQAAKAGSDAAPAAPPPTSEAKVEPAPKAASQPEPPRAAMRGYGLQLASLRDPNGAPNEWLRLRAAFGSILGKMEHRVMRVDLGDRGIFYRIVAGSFTDKDSAHAACDKLEALKQGCLVVELN